MPCRRGPRRVRHSSYTRCSKSVLQPGQRSPVDKQSVAFASHPPCSGKEKTAVSLTKEGQPSSAEKFAGGCVRRAVAQLRSAHLAERGDRRRCVALSRGAAELLRERFVIRPELPRRPLPPCRSRTRHRARRRPR